MDEQKSMESLGDSYGDSIEEFFKSLPPGYRFAPTDLELILGFLKNKVNNQPLPIGLIPDVNLYSKDPTQLTAEYRPMTETEWYFFSPRDKKYRTAGSKPNRSAGNGYWKPTDADKPIYDNAKKRIVGHKRTLDFWQGKQRINATKTHWKMVEFTLVEQDCIPSPSPSPKNDMRLNTWVLCKIYKNKRKKKDEKPNEPHRQLPCVDSDIHAFDEDKPIVNASQSQTEDQNDRVFEFWDDQGRHGFPIANQAPILHEEPAVPAAFDLDFDFDAEY